jgi:molybdenum cofactor biosynthesis protein MoaC
MVDVSEKNTTTRTATAMGNIKLNSVAFSLLNDSTKIASQGEEDSRASTSKARLKAGGGHNVLVTAQLAGIMAAKSTSSLIPLCHPLPVTHVKIDFSLDKEKSKSATDEEWMHSLKCTCSVRCAGQTGVEMEALTGVSVALLTTWDMLKSVAGKEMVIENIRVVKKAGGKSGDFERE